MKGLTTKLLTVVIGLLVGAAVYYSLWFVFLYFGIIN